VVLIAELRAINDAVRVLPYRRLTVLTDSRAAQDMVRRWIVGDDVLPTGYNTERCPGLEDLVQAQRRIRIHQNRIDVQWVPGHHGEPLNEGADALARLASRFARRDSGLTAEEYRHRTEGIAEAFSSEFRRRHTAS
jgi:ribonuclease HI